MGGLRRREGRRLQQGRHAERPRCVGVLASSLYLPRTRAHVRAAIRDVGQSAATAFWDFWVRGSTSFQIALLVIECSMHGACGRVVTVALDACEWPRIRIEDTVKR